MRAIGVSSITGRCRVTRHTRIYRVPDLCQDRSIEIHRTGPRGSAGNGPKGSAGTSPKGSAGTGPKGSAGTGPKGSAAEIGPKGSAGSVRRARIVTVVDCY